jgi:hypothetical protein
LLLIPAFRSPDLSDPLTDQHGLDPVIEVPHVKDATLTPLCQSCLWQGIVMIGDDAGDSLSIVMIAIIVIAISVSPVVP